MQIYKAPVDDIRFLMELFDYTGKVASLEAYQDFDLESAMAIIDEAAKFNTNEMLPLNRIGDQEGLKYNTEDFSVTTAPGFKELYDKFVEAGLVSLTQPAEFGGSGAPHTIGMVMSEFSTSSSTPSAVRWWRGPLWPSLTITRTEFDTAPRYRRVYDMPILW